MVGQGCDVEQVLGNSREKYDVSCVARRDSDMRWDALYPARGRELLGLYFLGLLGLDSESIAREFRLGLRLR